MSEEVKKLNDRIDTLILNLHNVEHDYAEHSLESTGTILKLKKQIASLRAALEGQRIIHKILKNPGERDHCLCGVYVDDDGQCSRLKRIDVALKGAERNEP